MTMQSQSGLTLPTRSEADVRAARDAQTNIERGPGQNALTHGHARRHQQTPTYYSWQAMLSRVRYAHRDPLGMWAARGISVCSRWQQFENFLADMGERPPGKTLDRFPNWDGDYEPGNCRWATPTEQARNTRHTILTFEAATEIAIARLKGAKCKDIADEYGISESLPREIVKGRCWRDAGNAARLILGIPLTCPFCGEDPGLARDIGPSHTLGRFIVGCESDDCFVSPAVSGSTLDEVWKRWNGRRA